ncbi:hypothetical protein F8M41_000252 [Gigaspora margarita]|uniref:F-box domain-containing protein n=1 Tax=Gigaspora margarita TaxID=4874 RepID=A0A8H4AZR0_GIGMA|nr:hypothetical protein F8M41_000252 [Gigaspora margarita]
MARKIFLGDMPEIMENILENLNNEFHFLYSCTLVSRHWCKITIPILWQDPFSFHQEPLFISTYLSSLGEDEKVILKERGINAVFSKTIFNYARFLKTLNLSRLESKVRQWIEFQPPYSKPYHGPLIRQISNLLFKLFIESGASLHNFDIYLSEFNEIKPEIFYSLGRNEQFFSRLQDLSLREIITEFSAENAITLLKILAKNSTKISTLKLEDFCSTCDSQVFHVLGCIIKSQEQLKRFNFDVGFPEKLHGIISALESQKQSLIEVIIEGCDYNAEFKVLMNCKHLEIIRIRHCDYEILLKILDCKISTLEVVDCEIDASKITLNFEKFGTSLQRLKLESVDEMILEQLSLIEALKSFCPNVTYLNISNIEFSTQLIDLIGNLQKLQFLTCSWCIDGCINGLPDKERITQFAKILPLTLKYLDLRNSCLNSHIDILLNNCYAPLKKLLINNKIFDNKKNLKALIDFCIRNRSLKYLGVNSYLSLGHFMVVMEYVTVVPYDRIVVNC